MPAALFVFGVLGVVSMVVYLTAVRLASWDLFPASVADRVRWWHRHAPAFLAVSCVVALVAVVW